MIRDLGIYKLPNGWEAAAVADEKDNLFLYREEEFSEGARPLLYFDPELRVIRFAGFDEDEDHGTPAKWTLIFLEGELENTDREVVACDVCGVPVWEPEVCPDVMDDKAWEMMALQHREDCEWIATRAFRL